MTEPPWGLLPFYPRRALVERVLFVASIALLVVSASMHPEKGSVSLVIAAVVCMGTVGTAWYRDEVSTREVLWCAVGARLLAFPLLPSLSDDGFRYVWDGWLQAEGLNPYLYRPSDEALQSFHRSELYHRLNSSNYYSVYPPVSQLAFWIGGLAHAYDWKVGWYVIKSILLIVECVGLFLLSRSVQPHTLLLYAWHPLVILEGAGQGHTEVAMVGFLLAAVVAFQKKRSGLAVAALTVAGWIKLYPLVLLPFMLRRVGWRYLWVSVVVSLVLALPYVHPSVPGHFAQSLDLYVRLFEFNAGPYYTLKAIGGWWTGQDVSKSLGPALRVAFFVGVAALFVWDGRWRKRRWSLPWVLLLALGWLWTTATTVHPWYLVGILGLLPLTLGPRSGTAPRLHAAAWHWLSLTALSTYLFYSVGPRLYWGAVIIGWGGWAVLMATAGLACGLPVLMRHRAASKWRWIQEYVGAPRRLLDLGAGEGYVGKVAAQETGAEVVLADIVDLNRTELPLVLYSGRHVPLSDGAFDVTLLVFVLHHSSDPEQVIQEAKRVTRGQIIVLESVVENQWDRRWLPFADTLANRIRSGGRMEEGVLHFGTPEGWHRLFESVGLEVRAEERKGRWLHKQHLFVLE